MHPNAERLLVCLAAGLLSACGGGGDPATVPPPPAPPATFTIGGTVAGLAGTLVLQIGSGEQLTISANGSFAFSSRVAAGTSYAVTVSSQPLGPDCAVTNGFGVANQNVSGIAVTCTVDSQTRFLPVGVRSNNAASGANGLYVASSKLIERPWVRVTADNVQRVSLVPELVRDANGRVIDSKPARFTYVTQGASGGDRLFRIELTGSSDLVPRQISNLNLLDSRVGNLCFQEGLLEDLNSLDSDFYILGVSSALNSNCVGISSAGRFLLIRGRDDAATPPVELPRLVQAIEPLYRPDGRLAGLLSVDESSRLLFYQDLNFAQPQVLLPYVGEFSVERLGKRTPWSDLVGDPGEVIVRSINADGDVELRTLDYNGSLSAPLPYGYRDSGQSPFFTEQQVYFSEATPGTAGLLYTFYRVARNGLTPPEDVFEYEIAPNQSPYEMVAADGQRALLTGGFDVLDPLTGNYLQTLYTVPLSVPGAVPQQLVKFGVPHRTQQRGGHLFLSAHQGFNPPLFRPDFSSAIYSLTGTAIQSLRTRSAFVHDPVYDDAAILQATDAAQSFWLGGAALTRVTVDALGQLAQAPMNRPSGNPMTIPGAESDAFFIAASPTVGMGWIHLNEQRAALYDFRRLLVVEAPYTDTEFAWFRSDSEDY
jgi:hypothetical protein